MAEQKIDKRQASRKSLMSAAASAEASQTKAQSLGVQTGVGTFIQRKKEYDKKRKELEEAANERLNSDTNEKEEKEKIKEDIKRDRNQYVVELNPGPRQEIIADTMGYISAVQDRIKAKDDISEIFLDEMEYDGDNFIYDQIEQFIKGKAVESIDESTGENILLFQDGEDMQRVPLNQFKQEVEKLKIDRDSQKNLVTLVDNVSRLAENEGGEFDYTKFQNQISQVINNSDTSLYSLANHKILNGNSFKNHMVEALEKGSYEDLGISPEEAKELDPTPNTRITPKDAEKITKTLIENEDDMLKDYLTKYYTDVLKLQYNMNLPRAQKPVTTNPQNNNLTTKNPITTEINTTEFS